MTKFLNTKNFLHNFLILELFEKLYRLKKYINTCEKFDRKNNNDKIINLFMGSIELIGVEVDKLTLDINSDIDDNARFAYVLKISQNSKAIVKLHEELNSLHSSWILPEIKTFTKEIVNADSTVSDEVNVILSDSYSFLESNLGKKFAKSLRDVYLKTEIIETFKENHSFILPKIEFSNPLNWTIIVHEAGHLKSEIISSLRENADIIPDDIHTLDEARIKNWAEEIFCDIYAISLLGPAYFVSFITFALLSTMDYGISSDSQMHPSVIIRASIMMNYLQDNKLIFVSEWGVEDYCKIFYDCLFDQHTAFRDEPTKEIKGLTKFNRNLRKLIKELKLNNFSIDDTVSKRIKNLVENLQKGIPIGSVCDEKEIDIEPLLTRKDLEKEELDKFKVFVTERSCKLWEILNAGWIFKLENSCAEGERIFFSKDSNDMTILD